MCFGVASPATFRLAPLWCGKPFLSNKWKRYTSVGPPNGWPNLAEGEMDDGSGEENGSNP